MAYHILPGGVFRARDVVLSVLSFLLTSNCVLAQGVGDLHGDKLDLSGTWFFSADPNIHVFKQFIHCPGWTGALIKKL